MKMFNTTALMLVISLSLSGVPVMAEDNQGSQNDQTETKTQGAFWGALIGGILGAILGNDAESKAKGAAIGAMLGGGAGFLLSSKVAERKQQYATREEAIAGETMRLESLAQEIRITNQQLKQDIQKYEQQIVKLQQDIDKGRATGYANLQRYKKRLQQRKISAEESLAKLVEELDMSQQLYKEYQRGNRSIELDIWQIKIDKLEQEKYQLQASIEDLTSMNSRL
ncbi:hypothetical protein [Candidatus Parabeggiatoa sp. HSG14]|uniref:hypothetical protein n=1 Tax=Candidatus Parabeggiatoa sp. HSG14 TaxID=3055593 RepID=UPI0025A6B18C|nr:glycine zipper domain-containing protein [Thiotrichales bacterium HSG14]